MILQELLQQATTLLDPFNKCYTDFFLKPLSSCMDCITLLKIADIKPITSLDGLLPLFNALHQLDTVLAYIIDMDNTYGLTIYIGLRATSLSPAVTLLENGLLATYPNLTFTILEDQDAKCLLKKIFVPFNCSSLTLSYFIPQILDATQNQTLTTEFLKNMGDSNYTLLALATPLSRCCIQQLIQKLEQLASELSAFSSTNFNESTRCFFGNSTNTSTTCNTSCSNTENQGSTTTNTMNHSKGNTTTYTGNGQLVENLNTSVTTNCASTENDSITKNNNTSNSCNNSESESKNASNTETTNKEDICAHSYRKENYTVQQIILQIQEVLKRLYSFSTTTAYCFSLYTFSPLAETSIRASYTYRQLFQEPTLHFPEYTTTYYSHQKEFCTLIDYLTHLCPPIFCNTYGEQLTPHATISPKELASLFFL